VNSVHHSGVFVNSTLTLGILYSRSTLPYPLGDGRVVDIPILFPVFPVGLTLRVVFPFYSRVVPNIPSLPNAIAVPRIGINLTFLGRVSGGTQRGGGYIP
jgi:hypothetical protein